VYQKKHLIALFTENLRDLWTDLLMKWGAGQPLVPTSLVPIHPVNVNGLSVAICGIGERNPTCAPGNQHTGKDWK
jgi:hypothetical protein